MTIMKRTGGLGLLFVLAAVCALLTPVTAVADEEGDENPIVRVEEDWVLWVYQPAGILFAPQFHTVISPVGNLDSYYFQITWNYWEMPSFAPGGFQVQHWNGDNLLGTNSVGNAELSLSAEAITWTQIIETNGNLLGFSILNGRSQTWGQFGYPETTIIQTGGVPDLNGYSPDVSIANSWITYGANRVSVLGITKVRKYNSLGELVVVDSTPRYVFGTVH